jgi:hypothetical protein
MIIDFEVIDMFFNKKKNEKKKEEDLKQETNNNNIDEIEVVVGDNSVLNFTEVGDMMNDLRPKNSDKTAKNVIIPSAKKSQENDEKEESNEDDKKDENEDDSKE